jgi:hypothetical protein
MGMKRFSKVHLMIQKMNQDVRAFFHSLRRSFYSIRRIHFRWNGLRILKSITLPPFQALRSLVNKITSRKRFIRRVKIAVLILIGLWIVSVGILSISLLVRARHLLEMTRDPAQLNLTAVASEVHGVRQEFSFLHVELAPVLWISGLFNGDLGAIQPLMDAGDDALQAADEVMRPLASSLSGLSFSTFSMKQVPQILDALAIARPAFEEAKIHMDGTAVALKRIKGPLSSRLEGWVTKANTLVQFAQFGLGGAKIMPELMGQAGSRTYLILLENSDELRPTGGFISAAGHVQINDGKLISISAEDSYAIDDFTKVYPDPPQPLLDYMGSEQWVLRDANWSPDFPTTALTAIQLYQISRQEQVEGVFGLTLKGVEMLFSGLGSMDIQGWPEPITPGNISRILKESWNPPQDITDNWEELRDWRLNRKQFVEVILQTAMEKLLAGEVNWKQLGQGMIDALNQRQLMIYTIPEANELKQLGWDGSLRASVGDYLMIVDANLGFNKVNPIISESTNYQVRLLPDGTGHAVVELKYVHQGTGTNVSCTQAVIYDENITYDKMVQQCYYDYMRLIVPRGSKLIEALAIPTPGKYLLSGLDADGKAVTLQDGLNDWTVFGQFFVVDYGKQLLTRLEYDLPVVIKDAGRQKRYMLLLQKQPGTEGMQVIVKITLPVGARLISTNLKPDNKSGNTLEFNLHLNVDQQLEVAYVPAK